MFKQSNTSEKELHLGTLEGAVMDVIWRLGRARVHDVKRELDRPLAYTTVMTTLDRLFRKRLVAREKADRAFIYSAAISEQELRSRRTGAILRGLCATPTPLREALISYLVHPENEYDPGVLDKLELKIQEARAAATPRGDASPGG